MHPFGCFIRIYHDARSPERQNVSFIITIIIIIIIIGGGGGRRRGRRRRRPSVVLPLITAREKDQ